MILFGGSSNDELLTWEALVDVISKQPIPIVKYEETEKIKKRFGRFFSDNSSLPIGLKDYVSSETKIDMKLFGLYDNSQFTYCWKNSEIQNTVPVVYIGVTGAGKTYQMQRHAAAGFVCYTTAGDRNQERDQYFRKLVMQLNSLQENEKKVAGEIVLFWIVIKLACLYSHLKRNTQYTPLEFAFSQINGSTEYYAKCFTECLKIKASTNIINLDTIRVTLIGNIRSLTKLPIGIAFDEAQMMIRMFKEG